MLNSHPMASNPILRFVLFWGLNVLVLWVADYLFSSVGFDSITALVVSGLVFGLAHTFVKPILLVLTLPSTVLTLGLFLLVINALILLLVAWLVPGFHVAGFWPAVLVGLFISIFSFLLNQLLSPRQP
jgi:putative membrane protein